MKLKAKLLEPNCSLLIGDVALREDIVEFSSDLGNIKEGDFVSIKFRTGTHIFILVEDILGEGAEKTIRGRECSQTLYAC